MLIRGILLVLDFLAHVVAAMARRFRLSSKKNWERKKKVQNEFLYQNITYNIIYLFDRSLKHP